MCSCVPVDVDYQVAQEEIEALKDTERALQQTNYQLRYFLAQAADGQAAHGMASNHRRFGGGPGDGVF